MKLIYAFLLPFLFLYPSVGVCAKKGLEVSKQIPQNAAEKGIHIPIYSNGNTLAHKMIEVADNMQGVQAVLSFGADLSLRNGHGENLFLFGYKYQVGLEALQYMLDVDPTLIKIQDNYGKTPLLTGLGYKNPLEVIQYTYDLYPEAIRIPDSRDRLPAHYVFRYKTDLDVKKFIIRMNIEALSVRDIHGKTPLDYAKKYRYKNPENYKKIMRFINDLKRKSNSKGNNETIKKPMSRCQNSLAGHIR